MNTYKLISEEKINPVTGRPSVVKNNPIIHPEREPGFFTEHTLNKEALSNSENNFPGFFVNFSGRKADGGTKFVSKINQILHKLNVGITHAGFIYIKPDGTPVYKEFGIKNGDSFWGNRVDLSNAPKYKKGQNPKLYMQSIYNYLNPASQGREAEILLIPEVDSERIEKYINSVDDTYYKTAGSNHQTCGDVAYQALAIGAGYNGEKPSNLQSLLSNIIPDGEENLQTLQRLDENYEVFKVREINEEQESELRKQLLNNSRNKQKAQYDFSNVKDRKFFIPKWFLRNVGHTCIYNGTSCIYPEHTLAKNETLIESPLKHGWREISKDEVQPGDAIILTDSLGSPKHFTIFDSVVPEGTEPYYYMEDQFREDNEKGRKPRMVYPGDTLLNYSPGTPRDTIWRRQAPLFRFDNQYNTAGGDFSGSRRYFRPIGLSNK